MMRIVGKALIGLLITGVIVFLFDSWCGYGRKKSDVATGIEGVSQSLLEQHVRELSSIGSVFSKVPRSSGIRDSPGETNEISKANQNLKPHGLAITNPQARERKLLYLEQSLREIGIQPKRLPFHTGKIGSGINLYGEIRGTKFPAKIIDVTAHYDTFADSPGADDNSSGVAGVLEIAKILNSGSRPSKTVRFVFFDLEELGLIGSRAYIKTIQEGKMARPDLCLNLEMIGYFTDAPNSQKSPARIPVLFEPPTVGNTIVTVGNFDSYRHGRKLDGVFTTYVRGLPIFSVSRWGGLIGNASRSDHYSYWEADIPALMLTDSANFRNPNYHQKSDLLDTIDFRRMRLVVQGAAAFVLEWAR